MIKRVMLKSGFLHETPHIKDRIFEFKPGLSVIIGNNGSGKSSLLKVMAAYCGIDKGGFSKISDPAKLGTQFQSHYPLMYRNYSPGKCDAIIEWDGTPTFYNDSDTLAKNDMTWFMNPDQSSDGISSEAEQLDVMASKPSSGQYRIHKLNKIMQMLQNPPKLDHVPEYVKSPEERAIAQFEVNYFNSLPRTGPMTILLDEPEKALSLEKQFELFDTLKQLAKHFQVIMVSHSSFVFYEDNVNFIEMTPGFVKFNKNIIEKRIGTKLKKEKNVLDKPKSGGKLKSK
jgi:energy-coupling factor transporter ATP-binding protein EcfA2